MTTWNTRVKILVGITTVVLGSMLGTFMGATLAKPERPVTYQAYQLVKQDVAPGEPLRVRIISTRKVVCPAKITRFVIDKVNKSPVWSEADDGGYSEVGLSEIFQPIHFGRHPQGDYEYYAISEHFCETGKFIIPHPRLPFRITLNPELIDGIPR